MWKKLGATTAILLGGSLAPIIPSEMTYLYSYQTTPQAIAEMTALANAPKDASTKEYLKQLKAPPYFEDDDGNGIISVSAFSDRKGNVVYVRIPDEQYQRMSERNAPTKGINANPTKEEYLSIFEALATPASAAVAQDATSGITSSASGATSYSVSHTTGASATYLATAMTDWSGDSATGCTFNSVSMTQLNKETRTPDSGSLEIYWYGLGAPDITTANVTCSRSSSSLWISVGSVSISGSSVTTSPVDATATEPGAAGQSSDTISITTVSDNTAVLIHAVADNCNIAASTNATEVLGATGTPSDCSIVMRSSTFPKTPAGSASYTFTFAANSGHGSVAISIAPAVVAAGGEPNIIIFE